MLFTTKELALKFTDHHGDFDIPLPIKKVCTDSRIKTNHSLFIPLIGENFDGHDYVQEAYNNGAIAIFWNKQKELPHFLPKDFPIFFVTDTTKALQDLASYYRNKINPTVIGITGSNGKTTTKDIVASIVSTTYETHYTSGNLNNHIGLPLTILEMSPTTEVLVLEMGMNNFKEIDRLSTIAKPDYAIITNIGESHLEYLGSREGIAKAKLEVLNGMKKDGVLIIDGDEPLLLSYHLKENIITCGYKSSNDFTICNVDIQQEQSTFTLGKKNTYSIPLLGKHNAKNATYAIILGEQLNISNENIKKGLSSLKLTSMRFEFLKGKNDVSIINDAYNASPTSMKASIEVVKHLEGFNEKVLILGDIFELGDQAKELHLSIASVINPPITAVLTMGNNMKFLNEKLIQDQQNIVCHHFESKEDLKKYLERFLKKDSLLLFKASRGMHFENIVEAIK